MQPFSWSRASRSSIFILACWSICLSLFAQTVPLPSSLRWYAAIAKQRGQSELQIGHLPQQMQQRAPKEIVHQNDLVVGTVEASLEANDDFQIFTWYRVRLSDQATTRLHLAAISDPRDKSLDMQIPQPFHDLKADEIIVRTRGGNVIVDGVSITQNVSVQMATAKKYLLFLKPLGRSVYEYGPETEPLPVREDGTLAPSSGSHFAHQFEKYPTVPALLGESR